MNDPDRRSDDELAILMMRGDTDAADALVRRYALDLYDFAVRTVLDVSVAMAVTESALHRAREEASQRPQALAFRAWLLGLARTEAFEGLRQRGRPDVEPSHARTPLSPQDKRLIQPADPAADHEAAVWAWQAARGQRPRDYSLLDLALRRRLTPGEIADIAGLSRTGVYAVLGRLRGAFEEGFAASALHARGRDACPDLENLVRSSGADLRAAVRWEMVRHAEACLACRETLASLPAAADLFVSLLEVEPPVELVERILPPLPEPAEATPDAEAATTIPVDAGLIEPDVADLAEAGAVDAGDIEPLEGAAGAAIPAAQLPLDAEPVAPPGLGPEDIEEPEPSVTDVAPARPEVAGPAVTDLEPDEAEAVEPAVTSLEPEEPEAPEPAAYLEPEEPGTVEPAATYAEPEEPGTETAFEEPEEEEGAFEPVAPPARPSWLFRTNRPGEEPRDDVEVEDEDGASREPGGALVPAATTAAASSPSPVDRIRFVGGDMYGPPRRPWDRILERFGDGGGRRRYWLFALLAGVTLLAAYIGIALGDSIQGGGESGGVVPLLPTRTSGVKEIACGTGPITLDQGSRATLAFDPHSLPSYQISDLTIKPVSSTAGAQFVSAKAQEGLSILFEALPVANSAGRTDEYQLNITFSRGNEKVVSDCTVRVRGPAATPTPAASPSPAATATRTPAPVPPTQAPPAPTSVPPTSTQEADTPTPEPTNTPPPSPTPTVTPIASVTPTATATP